MLKHECPHCGGKTISPIKKAFTGNQQSRGTVCPNCGKRCTNGTASAVFHVMIDVIALVIVVFTYIKVESIDGLYIMAATIAAAFLITRIADAFFFRLVPAIRIDYDR